MGATFQEVYSQWFHASDKDPDTSAVGFEYYHPYSGEGEMRVEEASSRHCVLQIVKLPQPHWVADQNVGRWAEGALELMGKKEKEVAMTRSMSGGDPITEYRISWH